MMFDRYVADQHRPITGRSLLILGSVVVHAVLVIALVIYSFVHVEEVAPPPLTVVFVSSAAPPPPPPPPPPPAGKKTSTPKTPKTPIVQPKDVQPLTQPKEAEKPPEEDDEDDGEEGGVEGGVKGGVAGGVVGGVVGGTLGGVLGGTVTNAPPPPPPPPPKKVPPHVFEQAILSKVLPHLPDVVKIQRRGTGPATYRAVVCIDAGGAVTKVQTIQSIPGGDEVCIDALRQWRFKPQPLPICSVVELEFQFE